MCLADGEDIPALRPRTPTLTCQYSPAPREGHMTAVTIAQLRATPTVDLMTAARALGLGRTKAYDLARRQQFPCRVIRIGDTYRVPTPGLLELLGLATRSQAGAQPTIEPDGGELGDAYRLHAPGRWPCRLQPPPDSSHPVGRDPVAERATLPSETGAEPVYDRLDAHRASGYV
jgi:hypothetical protein